jgi:poly-gamma-glutamate synthesis protein (capsule biosynthesis protein)
MSFTFDPAMLPVLKGLGFTTLSQANNHASNFGAEGLHESQAAIRASGMETFGDPSNSDPGPLYQTIRGEQIAFVGYHQFQGTDARVIAAIKKAKETGAFVIVYPHWGTEYSTTTTAFQRAEAHAFVDAGADLILGAHPHVVEPIEVYRGRAIFYSVGNFIFDQSNIGPTAEGLAVRAAITSTQVNYSLVPLSIRKAQASLMTPQDAATLLGWFARTAELPPDADELRSGIASSTFSLSR